MDFIGHLGAGMTAEAGIIKKIQEVIISLEHACWQKAIVLQMVVFHEHPRICPPSGYYGKMIENLYLLRWAASG